MSDDVRIVYRKYDGSLHWNMIMKRLGEDEHGVWTGADSSTAWHKGDGPPVVVGHPHVMLFPRDTWWTASFNSQPAMTEIYCDISTPVRWPDPHEVTMVDLDLDVVRRRADGQVVLLDEDEFAEDQVKYGYPDDVIRASLEAAEWLMVALADGTEPFASAYLSYLAMVEDPPVA
jgi:uncharacterized protein